MSSSGFTRTYFSVNYRPFLYLLTFDLVIKPLLLIHIVVFSYFIFRSVCSAGNVYGLSYGYSSSFAGALILLLVKSLKYESFEYL